MRIATTVVLSGGLALAALGLGTGTAQAEYWFNWCPGQPQPYPATNRVIDWDWNVCHSYRYNGNDVIDEAGRVYPATPPPPGAICGTDLFTGRPIYC